jgi:hypothetical protein
VENCPQVLRRRVAAAALSGLLVLPGLACAALADPAAPKARFGTSVDELGFPSLGRIVFVFVLIAALAVATVVVLRRFWPALLRRKNSASGIRPLDRTSISATLTVHVVEVEGVKMLIAEGSRGIAVVPLPAPRASTSSGNTNITS